MCPFFVRCAPLTLFLEETTDLLGRGGSSSGSCLDADHLVIYLLWGARTVGELFGTAGSVFFIDD